MIACKKVDAWNAQIQEVLLKVSRQILQQQDHAEPKPEIVPMPPSDVPHWKSLPELTELPHGAVRWYGLSIVRKMVDWFWPIVLTPKLRLFGCLMRSCSSIMDWQLERLDL